MKPTIVLLLSFLLLCGCSGINPCITPDGAAGSPRYQEAHRTTHWIWDTGLYRVSDDHATIERLPMREGEYHFNITRLAEPPNCIKCLQIGKPSSQPDGTLKIPVSLSHPFPSAPLYTGFDVRGIILFPATRYWEREPNDIKTATVPVEYIFPEDGPIPLYFSRAEDGGGQLLNADGFTMFFFPGWHVPGYDLPIFQYNKGIYANGLDPDSTINGYKLFTNDPNRRMFRTNETITRTYHIAATQGEFIFGYVVEASWAPPTATPVTDPANDFPFWANCEDGYVLEFEQIHPFKTGFYGPPSISPWPPVAPWVYDEERHVTAATLMLSQVDPEDEAIEEIDIWLHCPDLSNNPDIQTHGVAYSKSDFTVNSQTHIYNGYQWIGMGSFEAEPGQYVALLYVRPNLGRKGWDYEDNNWPAQLYYPAFFDFITLEVIAGD